MLHGIQYLIIHYSFTRFHLVERPSMAFPSAFYSAFNVPARILFHAALLPKVAMQPSTWLGCNDTLHQLTFLFFLLSFAISHSSALFVVGGSNCTSACFSPLTFYNTNGSDISCHDTDYNSTSVGVEFQECVSCEIQSQAIPLTGEQSDLGWALCKLISSLLERSHRSTDPVAKTQTI